MQKFVVSAALAVGLIAAPAYAADLTVYSAPEAVAAIYAPVSASNWGGFYAGVGAGYSFGQFSDESGFSDDTFDIDGWTGGAQAGYNYDLGGFVVGVEADISASSVGYEENFGAVTESADLNYFGTVRARAGVAYNQFLPYVTAGFAYGEAELSSSGPGGTISQTENHTGWTAGFGVETAATSNITVKTEYLYTDLGDQNYAGVAGSTGLQFHTIRTGLNFKF